MLFTLSSLKVGEVAVIANLMTEQGLHHRLSALGIRPGRQVSLLRRAWFSGPLHLRVGTTELMLRHQEAQQVYIRSAYLGVDE
ncbi:MAG: ferrous iron transport protein A [Oscillatoriophycideae cyanobacterium NC_groundwater_1537_Pr4_S-0.65um_50_18]|nr:ferrous iron transport protein A [Oscillatoriophycideae cyanobacterium NC_groundwater_1537_Pr4_S-0.65um_50_18]